ncbi:hypothetical protein ZWY2020_002351 [Hordeum vulgare]|nr:hypothetical protein ZWY2020_002351 [Hordeum vulgare]
MLGMGGGSYFGVAGSNSNNSELEPTQSELCRDRKEVEEEDVEVVVAFEAIQEYLDVHGMEDEAEEDMPTPSYDVAVLTSHAEEALHATHRQLDQTVLAASVSTAHAEAVRYRVAEEDVATQK